jgi:hypothetical protein
MDYKARLATVTRRNRKLKPGETPGKGKEWPIENKMEAVQNYLVLGNMRMVSAVTQIDYDLLRKWKGQPWWAEFEREIRATQNIELDNKLSKVLDKSLDAVLDRVENGDFIYDQKSGEIRRKPAALRDLHRVAVDSITKREVIRTGDQQSDTAKLSVEEHLKMLAQEMAKWNKTQEKKPITIDLEEVEDAVYEEREAGLQTGSGELYEQTGSSEEEDPAERGPEGSDESGTGEER